ncbi:MAG: Asp-tRNA(Asn)/Glu-tRNA(Gln) amidotransferase subunit GatA [Candidatus Taylorbacteria bacterium]
MINLTNLTIAKAHEHLTKGDFSAVELASSYLASIESQNKDVNAYLEVFDDVLSQAKFADEKLKSKNATVLTGIPLALKDNILMQGHRAGAASKILEGFVAPYDATAISKLKKEGAVFLGRTNMDEFAMGSSTENSAYGVTKNPLDFTRVAGGSSGGSAAAVAMDGALASLGSDTGGSVRQPASFCGVVGLKPTYGAVSRYGLIAMGSSLDQIGPIGKTVEDVEILFNAIKGKDSMDSTSFDPLPNTSHLSPKNLTVGVPYHFMKEGIDADVLRNFEDSIKKLQALGYKVKEITLPNIKYSLAVYYIIMPAESSSNLARFDGVKYGMKKNGENLLGDYLNTRSFGFGPEVRRRIMLGNYILSSGYYDAYYNRAHSVTGLIKHDFKNAFEGVDVIATPTSPTPAFKIGEKSTDPLSMYLSDIFTVTANMAGIPAISLPSGFAKRDGKELPLGFQIMAPHQREDLLFEIGKKFEARNPKSEKN